MACWVKISCPALSRLYAVLHDNIGQKYKEVFIKIVQF